VKRSIFGRIFLLYGVVLIAGLLVAEIYITRVVRESHIMSLKESLKAQASLMADDVSFDAQAPEAEPLAASLKEKTGARVTIIAPDGAVLGDSDEDASRMDNHAGRPEIRQAAYAGTGSSARHSDTLNMDFLYTAVRVSADGETAGFVRLAVPLTEVEASVNRLRLEVFLVVVLVLSVTGAFHVWQTWRLRRLTVQVKEFLGAIVHEDFGKRLFFEGMGEFSEIAENLNAMSAELNRRIEEGEEERHRLSVILRSIPDALLIIDPRDTIALASAASREVFGGAEPVRGRSFMEVVRSHEFTSLVEEVRAGREPSEREIRLDRPEEKHLSVMASPLFYRGAELSGVLAIFHDITRLKQLEQVRKDFVANVSHEIRTPVASIKGYAETLLEGALDDRENARKFLATIKSNSERLNALVEDLLTISRLELGALRVEKAEVDLAEAVGHVAATFEGRASEKGIYIKTDISPEARTVMADGGRLVQILTNLVDNAVKFTEDGGVTISARGEDGAVVLAVEDTGIGVPKKYLPRLGERFFRVDPSRSRALGGTGLGLAIVKHLVRAHGWQMVIESAEGRGTTVRIIARG